MPYKKCLICNKEFYSKPNKGKRGKYCSRECYSKDRKSKWLTVKCANCGKEIIRPQWRFNTKPMKHYFCSKKCYGQYKSKHADEYPLSKIKHRFIVATELTENLLRKEYSENRLRIKDISRKYNCGYSTIQARLKKYNIKTDRGRYRKGNSEAYWRKYFQRKYKGCQHCGWDKDVCDVAHIKSRKKGGEYIEKNLLYLCPNCHRLYDKGKLKI
jgi:hypothetical protein